MNPFLKWAGGKRQLLPELMKHVPGQFGKYHEPFVGGGALFWHLRNGNYFPARLGDSNERLMRTYRAVKTDVEKVIAHLEKYENTEKEFYAARDQSYIDGMTRAQLAAWFVYLNKTCFNGLYRVNKAGKFNVPFGRYENPTICDADGLRECARELEDVELFSTDFEHTVHDAVRGDFVYFDPPYIPVAKTSFTAYDKAGFGMEDHKRLAGCAKELKRRGVHVLLSNSSAPIVRELYDGFEIVEVMARRSVNSKASGRGAVKEAIIK